MNYMDIKRRCKKLGIRNYGSTKFLLEYLLDHYVINQAQKEVLSNIRMTIGNNTCDSATEIIYYTQLNTLLDQYESKLNCK